MVNFGSLTAGIDSRVLGHPSKINWFRVLASLLHRRRGTEVNQTARCLAVFWAGTVYTFMVSCPLTEFSQVQNSLCVQVFVLLYIGSVDARHSSSGRQPKLCSVQQRAPSLFRMAAITFGIGPHSRNCIEKVHPSFDVQMLQGPGELVRLHSFMFIGCNF